MRPGKAWLVASASLAIAGCHHAEHPARTRDAPRDSAAPAAAEAQADSWARQLAAQRALAGSADKPRGDGPGHPTPAAADRVR